MAIRFTIRNDTTSTVLATTTLPDAMVARLQRAFPAPNSADKALAYMMSELRKRIRELNLAETVATTKATVEGAEAAEAILFDLEFPP